MSWYKLAAAKLIKKTITGRFGPFEAYVISGDTISDTYNIKDSLKNLGFAFSGTTKSWWLASKKINNNVINSLRNLGVIISGEPETPAKPVSPTEPASAPTPEKKVWQTEDEEMTRWYGFPINKNILSFDVTFDVNGEEHTEPVTIDRSYVMGGDIYQKRKSTKFRGYPKYVAHIGKKSDGTSLSNLKSTSKEKWGTYDEQKLLNTFQEDIKRILADPKSRTRAGIDFHYNLLKRDDNFKNLLKEINNNKSPEYTIRLENPPEYSGNYSVTLENYSGENAAYVYAKTNIKHPLSKHEATLGMVDINDIHTIDEFNKRINDYLLTNKPKELLLEYLKTFPFLESQQTETKQDFDKVRSYLIGDPDTDEILQELTRRGYIRPSKRQKQMGPGLSTGEEIKWIVDSKKIVNDAYGYGYIANTPNYFYAVLAYYIHRKVRGIWSWTDMMLVDAMDKWRRTMENYGLDIDFEKVNAAIESIGKKIISKIYGKEVKEEQWGKFKSWFEGEDSGGEKAGPASAVEYSLKPFLDFAQQQGIDIEGINEENIKKVYKALLINLHPDRYQDPAKKVEMEKKFKDLQNIWDEVPEKYKVATNWYQRYIFGSKI